jgi:MFS family permease
MEPNRKPPLSVAFRALRIPNYRLFWVGQLVSLTGTWMQSIAQAWLVLRLTNSPFALGAVTMAQTLPFLLLSLFGGVIADRVSKRRLLVITQTAMLVDAFVLGLLTSTGRITLAQIYVLVAVMGTASAIDNPTRQAFVSEMVGPDDLPNAVALNSAQFNAARLIGPALGGLAVALIGIGGAFYVNAVSYLAVIGSLLLMRPERFFGAPRPSRGNVIGQIGEGLGYALRTPDIALIVLVMAVVGTFGYNFTVILPLIAKYVLNTNAFGLGVLTSAMAVGSLTGALGIAYLGRADRRTLFVGAAGFSVLLVLVALSGWWVLTIPLLAALGLFSIVFTATANTRMQLVAPPQLRGRVMSIYTLLFMGSTPFGSLIVGGLADRLGVQPAIAAMGLVCILGVAAGLIYLRHNHDRLRPEPPSRRLPAPAAARTPAVSS